MAIHNQTKTEGDSGFKKQFEPGSEEILLDLVQSHQYQFPIQSAIREIVTNCTDSIREKQQFFLINSGQAKPEDFYIHREEEMYKDSNYNSTYYNEKWLSKTENRVRLQYKIGGNIQRDTLHIIDTGVGLGGLRLEKHFNPLFSTKRNTDTQTGKFGIGSKAGLALEVDYYSLITRYNGCEFHFNIYDYKVDPTVPRLNMVTGKENPYYEMETSTELVKGMERKRRIYYLPTKLSNGVEVILQAKKGLQKEFIDAIKGQLLYLDDIDFEIHCEDGTIQEEVIKAEIEYEDDIFVLPTADSTYYSKPHIILNGICYGYVNFLQMEEEDRAGNIGMKINPGSIDINPNRESVRWTPKTTAAIHETFKKGEKIAEKILTAALVSDDLIEWALKCAIAIGGSDTRSVIGRFSNIVDLKGIKPKFNPLPKIEYYGDPQRFFPGYEVWEVHSEQRWSKAKQVNIASLNRTKVRSWSEFNDRGIFYQDKDTTFRQEMFMLTIYPNGFIKIIPKGAIDFKEGELTKEQIELLENTTYEEYGKLDKDARIAVQDAQHIKWENDRKLMDELIKGSVKVDMYSSIIVPEDYRTTEKEEAEDIEAAEAEVLAKLTPAEQRALQNKIVATGFCNNYNHYYRLKYEPRIKEILEDKGTIIYGFAEDEANLALVSELLFKQHTNSWSDTLKVVMISQSNAKYFKPHIYVDDFFTSVNTETNTISMHSKLVKWQTARKLNDVLPRLEFLTNFHIFDKQASDTYTKLVAYRDEHFIELQANMHRHKGNDTDQIIEGLKVHTDKITELQLFVMQHPGNYQAIAAMSKALFDTDEEGSFKDAIGIELNIYRELLALQESAKPVAELFNHIDVLTSSGEITYNLEREIKDYMEHKGYVPVTTVSEPTPQVEKQDLIEA